MRDEKWTREKMILAFNLYLTTFWQNAPQNTQSGVMKSANH
jgi:hypothetical protein